MHDSIDQKTKTSTGQNLANDLELTYKSIEAEFDILEQLERHGDINDPVYLRAELKKNSYILAQERIEKARRE